MARTPAPARPDIEPEGLTPRPPSPGLLAVAEEEAAVRAHVVALADQLGYDGSLTVGALEDEIRFYQRRSVEAVLELGKRLILLKEMSPHGEFIHRIELLGINERMARRFMSSTLKFTKTDTKSVLTAAGNQTKLLELLVLDDGEIQELAEGGTVRGLTLDDVDTMSASELRRALRDARANGEAKDRLLAEKGAQIDKLALQLEQPKERATPKWDVRVLGMTDEIANLGTVGDEIMGKHLTMVDVCMALVDALDPDAEDYRDRMEQARVPISRLGEQLERWAHMVARLRFEFDTRVGGYLDKTHILDADD